GSGFRVFNAARLHRGGVDRENPAFGDAAQRARGTGLPGVAGGRGEGRGAPCKVRARGEPAAVRPAVVGRGGARPLGRADRGQGSGGWPRREIDQLGEAAQREGAKGLAWIVYGRGEPRSPIAKFLTPEELEAVGRAMEAKEGDLLLFVADRREVANEVLGRLR